MKLQHRWRTVAVAIAAVILLGAGVGVAAVTGPTIQHVTYTAPDRVITIPGETYTTDITVPTVTNTSTVTQTQTVTQTVTVTAPSSTPAAASNPIAIERLGNWGTASDPSRYSTVLVDRASAADAAAALPATTRVLAYMAGVDVNTGWNTGIDYQTALANGWLLKNADGSYTRNLGYPDNYIADIGSTAYQHAWASAVASFADQAGVDGIYIDDILGDSALLTGGHPAKYPTRDAWADAMASFVAYVGPYLQNHGLYVLVNASSFISGDVGSNDGSTDLAWWHRVAPNVNGLMKEYFQQQPNNVSQVFNDCACDWTGWWSKWQLLETYAQSVGDDFYSLAYGAASDDHLVAYERASFLIDWDGSGGGMIWNPDGSADPASSSTFTRDPGAPVGGKTLIGSVWKRQFANLTVYLNPTTSSQTADGHTIAAASALFVP